MAYADYDYYVNEYGGSAIAEADFKPLANKASVYIDWATSGQAQANAELESVKMCCCDLAEQYQIIEMAKKRAAQSLRISDEGGGEVSSETVGSWSKSYQSSGYSAQTALQAAKENEAALMKSAKVWLGNTGMLQAVGYRGCSR